MPILPGIGASRVVDVASVTKAAGTEAYTIGYGVDSGRCATDSADGFSACKTLQQIARSNANLFVDTLSAKCSGATSVVMNGQIFNAIAGDLTASSPGSKHHHICSYRFTDHHAIVAS